jgi:hypothetical protein
MKRSTKKQIITWIVLLTFGGSIVTTAISMFPSSSNQQTIQRDWAARLNIVINNELYTIPAGVGVTGNKTTAKLFTTSNDGIMYKTGEGDATLKDFFTILGQNFNETCIFEFCNTNTSSMRMYVNNVQNTNYELYTIKNGDSILIDYR